METINSTSQKHSDLKQTSKFNQGKFISNKNVSQQISSKESLDEVHRYLKVASKQNPKISAVSPFGNNHSSNLSTQGHLTEKAKLDH